LDGKIQLPIGKWKLLVNAACECEQVIVRDEKGDSDNTKLRAASAGTIATNAENVSGYRKHHGQKMEVQAVMGSSLDAVSRYRSGLKRDLYRAIDELLKIKDVGGQR
jgi:hypothetical protein